MKRLFNSLRVFVPAAAVMIGVLVMGSGAPAFAYGKAANPVAQVEISGNCDNASVCPNLGFGGTGGVWIWAELDATSQWATSGTVDYTFAGCGHTVGGVGGPGGAGGGGGPAHDGTWQQVSFSQMLNDAGTYFPVDLAVDKYGNLLNVPYYEIALPAGNPSQPFLVAVPVPFGHYSAAGLLYPTFTKVPGISFQTQVAP